MRIVFVATLLLVINSVVVGESKTSASISSDGGVTVGQLNNKKVKIGHNNDNTPTLRVIMIRHGESYNNIQREMDRENYAKNRKHDPELTENGHLQAKQTAEYLLSNANRLLGSIDDLYVSPLLRTMLTAAPISESLGLPAKVWTEIYEVGGVYENGKGLRGMTRSQMAQLFPTYILPDEVEEDGWYDVSRGKETKAMGKERITNVFTTLQEWARECQQEGKDRTIALVVHGDFIDYVVQSAYGVEGTSRHFPCYNTCITAIDITADGKAMVLFHNSVAHLPPSLVKFDKLGRC